jgi:hypothetical protein
VTDPDTAEMLALLEELNGSDIEAVIARCHADVVAEPVLARVEGGAFVGHEGMRRWFAERDAAWETIHVEATSDVRRAGTHLLVDTKFRSRARESGVEIDVDAVLASQRRDDKFIWWAVFWNEGDALARIHEREHDTDA